MSASEVQVSELLVSTTVTGTGGLFIPVSLVRECTLDLLVMVGSCSECEREESVSDRACLNSRAKGRWGCSLMQVANLKPPRRRNHTISQPLMAV